MQDRIEKVVELAAPISRVWTALTDYNQFGEWFRVKLDGPFKPGEVATEVVTYEGPHEGVAWEATVEKMDLEQLFSFRWPAGIGEGPTTLVEFRLEATGDGTRLTITESGFSALADPERLEALRDNTGGWNAQAKNIADYVAS